MLHANQREHSLRLLTNTQFKRNLNKNFFSFKIDYIEPINTTNTTNTTNHLCHKFANAFASLKTFIYIV